MYGKKTKRSSRSADRRVRPMKLTRARRDETSCTSNQHCVKASSKTITKQADDDDLSTGAYVGIAVGGAVFVALVAVIAKKSVGPSANGYSYFTMQ